MSGDVQAGEQVVEVVHGAGAEQRAGDAGVGDGERHREVGHGQARLRGERDELLDDVEAALVGEVVDHAGAAQVVVLVLADAAGEQALAERAPDQGAHAEALGGGQDLALDAAVEDGVGRLLGVEPREAAPLGDPLGLDDVGGGGLRGRRSRGPCRCGSGRSARTSVSSMSVSGSGRWSW